MRLSWAFHIDSVPFTKGVIAGTESLGGSESACLGLARALAKRGHRVVIFTTRLDRGVDTVDHAGVRWYHTSEIPAVSHFIDWDVFVALRMPHVFQMGIQASLRMLWNQDLMVGEAAKQQTMAMAWAYDVVAYVSQYHRKQWEGCIPELAPYGWVTKNGYDPALVPTDAVKHPKRIIHITRPERALRPLLAMWPELRRRVPDAELHICRYQSMYDGEGSNVRAMCEAFDQHMAQVQAQVGGITFLGPQGKPALYKAIAESAVMWYPGVADFAETSCVAAIEAQACGTPFVGSYKGALPETVPYGFLIEGDADTADYQAESIDIVQDILEGVYPAALPSNVVHGLEHVKGYTYDAIADEWEGFVETYLSQRLDAQPARVLEQLMHEDDHVLGLTLAKAIGDDANAVECQRIIDGKDMDDSAYAERALDPRLELKQNPRMESVVSHFAGCKHVLDLACGNGTMALGLALAHPEMRVTGVDYSAGNIEVAQQVALEMGLADRVTFICAPVYDFSTHEPTLDRVPSGDYDGIFCGEFFEHIANVSGFLSSMHAVVPAGARIVCTMPSGPFGELAPRDMKLLKGHVHHYRPDDLEALFGAQADLDVAYLDAGMSTRGSAVGHWLVSYRTSDAPIGERPIAKRLLTTRPYQRLSVGILAGSTEEIRACLKSVWPVADQIILGDTGGGAEALAQVAAEFPRTIVVPVGRVHDLSGGFSEARNRVLAEATGEWFLWIDTDERLMHPENLAKYLQGGAFNGYAIKQNHLMLDVPNTFDTPVRLFKRRPDIQFYGCIHEQPQMGDCNGEIIPALQLHDCEIAHTGYLDESIRRDKALSRNLPLLVRDQQMFPDRQLGKVLVLRDCLNLGFWQVEAAGGKLTEKAKEYFHHVIGIFEGNFNDPAHKYHALARPFYEQALQRVAGAMEVEVAFAAQENGLKGRAKPERHWVRTPEQLDALIEAKRQEWLKPLKPAAPVDCEPFMVTTSEPEAAHV